MTWKVKIEGSESDIKYFSNALNSEELSIIRENGYTVLNSNAFASLLEYNELEMKLRTRHKII